MANTMLNRVKEAGITAAATSTVCEPTMILLHATRHCNLRCEYCYQPHTLPSDNRMIMGSDVVEALASSLRGISSKPKIVLHGGEPLLQSLDWIRHFIRTMQKLGATCGIQTNATLLSDDVADALCEGNVRIGISCDGPPYINDATRGMSSQMEQGIGRLRERGCTFGVITVVSTANFEHITDILDYIQSLGASTVRLNPIAISNQSPLWISKDLYEEVLAKAWNWQYAAPRTLVVDNVVRLERHLLGLENESCLCHSRDCGAGRYVYAVDYDGSIYPCNRYIGSRSHRQGRISPKTDWKGLSLVRDFIDRGCASVCPAFKEVWGLDYYLAVEEFLVKKVSIPKKELKYAFEPSSLWRDIGYSDWSDWPRYQN